MLHRAAIPLVTHSAASCLASGDLLVLHLKIDIFCHLSIFFLTSALFMQSILHKQPPLSSCHQALLNTPSWYAKNVSGAPRYDLRRRQVSASSLGRRSRTRGTSISAPVSPCKMKTLCLSAKADRHFFRPAHIGYTCNEPYKEVIP